MLIVTPPLVNEFADERTKIKYKDATEKSKKLNEIYKEVANKTKCYFLSNKNLVTGIDGVHLIKESHEILADELKRIINKIYS